MTTITRTVRNGRPVSLIHVRDQELVETADHELARRLAARIAGPSEVVTIHEPTPDQIEQLARIADEQAARLILEAIPARPAHLCYEGKHPECDARTDALTTLEA